MTMACGKFACCYTYYLLKELILLIAFEKSSWRTVEVKMLSKVTNKSTKGSFFIIRGIGESKLKGLVAFTFCCIVASSFCLRFPLDFVLVKKYDAKDIIIKVSFSLCCNCI